MTRERYYRGEEVILLEDDKCCPGSQNCNLGLEKGDVAVVDGEGAWPDLWVTVRSGGKRRVRVDKVRRAHVREEDVMAYIASAAESIIEDDLNESGEWTKEEHAELVARAMDWVKRHA